MSENSLRARSRNRLRYATHDSALLMFRLVLLLIEFPYYDCGLRSSFKNVFRLLKLTRLHPASTTLRWPIITHSWRARLMAV